MKEIDQQYSYLFEKLPIIEVCLFIKELSIADFVMYFEHNIRFEERSEIFKTLSTSPEFLEKLYRGDTKRNLYTLERMMYRVSDYINFIDKDDNNAKIVYKRTLDSCNKIINKIDKKTKTWRRG